MMYLIVECLILCPSRKSRHKIMSLLKLKCDNLIKVKQIYKTSMHLKSIWWITGGNRWQTDSQRLKSRVWTDKIIKRRGRMSRWKFEGNLSVFFEDRSINNFNFWKFLPAFRCIKGLLRFTIFSRNNEVLRITERENGCFNLQDQLQMTVSLCSAYQAWREG